ncbi:MAG: glycerophosphodiester phosphodiesterase [Betaproteobacteria bacterium]
MTARTLGVAALAAAFVVLAPPAAAFDLQGHRGARGLAPENTLAAFGTALAIGVTTLETDLAVTKDGVLVISHDPFLNPDLVREQDGRWLAEKGPRIHALTLAELQRYDIGRIDPASRYARQFPAQTAVDGERFPTLAEVLDLGRAQSKTVRFNLETKITPGNPDDTVDPATFARLVVAAVRTAGLADRVTIQSFDWRTLIEAKKLAPGIATVCLTIETPNNDTVRRTGGVPSPWQGGLDLAAVDGSLPKLVAAAGCSTWSPFWRNLTPTELVAAHALKLAVVPWTVNDAADMATLIDMGVDGMITDYPDRLRAVLAGKGIALP